MYVARNVAYLDMSKVMHTCGAMTRQTGSILTLALLISLLGYMALF